MARTRVTVVVGIVPWLAANFVRVCIMTVLAVAVFMVPLFWPVMVFHTVVYSRPLWHGATPMSHWRVTPLGWDVEIIWLGILLTAGRAVVLFRKARKNHRTPAVTTGPRDWAQPDDGRRVI